MFKEKYTTQTRKLEDDKLPKEEQKEQKKIVLSEEAYANCELLDNILAQLRRLT